MKVKTGEVEGRRVWTQEGEVPEAKVTLTHLLTTPPCPPREGKREGEKH